jgi:hypothetical protein
MDLIAVVLAIAYLLWDLLSSVPVVGWILVVGILFIGLAVGNGLWTLARTLTSEAGALRKTLEGVEAEVREVRGAVRALRRTVRKGRILLPEDEVFGSRHMGLPLTAVSHLQIGDVVVHKDHGLARYGGLKRMTVDNREGDYLVLDFAEGDQLFLPLERIAQLSRRFAVDGGETVTLNRLGSPLRRCIPVTIALTPPVRRGPAEVLPRNWVREASRAPRLDEQAIVESLRVWLLEHQDQARVWRIGNPQGFGEWAERLGPEVIRRIWPEEFPAQGASEARA